MITTITEKLHGVILGTETGRVRARGTDKVRGRGRGNRTDMLIMP